MNSVTKMTAEEFTDHRGTILSFYPQEPIVEYNLMITRKGDERGYHYHPHFNEYMIVVEGECMFSEFTETGVKKTKLNTGDSIRIPIGVPHTFTALTDFKFVSLLTKRWHDSEPPIVKVDENGNEITS